MAIVLDEEYRSWATQTLHTLSDVSGEWESNGILPVSTWMRAPFTLKLRQNGDEVDFFLKSPLPGVENWTASIRGSVERVDGEFRGAITSIFSTITL